MNKISHLKKWPHITMLTCYDFQNEKEQTFTCLLAIRQKWKDEYLVWDPDDYGGLATIRIPSYKLWLPDLVISNLYVETLVIFKLWGWECALGHVERNLFYFCIFSINKNKHVERSQLGALSIFLALKHPQKYYICCQVEEWKFWSCKHENKYSISLITYTKPSKL